MAEDRIHHPRYRPAERGVGIGAGWNHAPLYDQPIGTGSACSLPRAVNTDSTCDGTGVCFSANHLHIERLHETRRQGAGVSPDQDVTGNIMILHRSQANGEYRTGSGGERTDCPSPG